MNRQNVKTTVAVFEVPDQDFKVSFVNGRIEVPTALGGYKTILRTFQSVFPNATLWYTGGSHTLVLATPDPLVREALTTIFAPATTNQVVIDDLGPPPAWLRYLAMEAEELRTHPGWPAEYG